MTLTADDKINYGNALLMLISVVAAFIMPFELFLLAYAILGPLHYLTEISWLHKSKYYVHSNLDPLLLVLLGLVATAAFFNPRLAEKIPGEGVVFMAFFAAFFMVFVKNHWLKLSGILSGGLILLLVSDAIYYKIIFGVFLPTLVHVFLFTGLFIILGALKSRSFSGLFSMLFFIICGSCFLWIGTDWQGFLTEKGKKVYELFLPVNDLMLKSLGADGLSFQQRVTADYLYYGKSAVILMRFIAFAYTYHYLNWFSKTKVIRWHEIPKPRMILIVVLWGLSVTIYMLNYKYGLKILYFLSMSHVFLEFPLNYRSVTGIFNEVKKRVVKV